MKTFKDYINADTLDWLHDNNIQYKFVDIKNDKGTLNILYNDKFCLKIYDRLGHGFSMTINLADHYDESIYENDKFNLNWALKYLKINTTSSFDRRTEIQYLQNLQYLLNDLKNIIPRLNQLSSTEWNNMKDWISEESKKQFLL
jgi:hypothetical protein